VFDFRCNRDRGVLLEVLFFTTCTWSVFILVMLHMKWRIKTKWNILA